MLQFLAVPLAGLAASVLGAGISAAGGLAGAAGGIIGGVASAAGGMLGGGESGNVQRDEDGDSGFERVSLGASPFGGTGGTSGGAGLPTVIPQTSLASSDTSPSEGSSPQEVMMSIFKSIQNSLISIDSTLGQMLGLQANALEMQAKNNTLENFERAEGDKKNKEGPKEKGFLGKTADRVGGIFNKAPNLFKILGLTALIASFKFFRTEIEGFIASVLSGGDTVFTSLKVFFKDTILPGIQDFFDFVLITARQMLNLPTPGSQTPGGDTQSSTGSTGADFVLDVVSTSDQEKVQNATSNIIAGKESEAEDDIKRAAGTDLGYIRNDKAVQAERFQLAISSMYDLYHATNGKVTFDKDILDRDIPIAERANAQAYVDGKKVTMEEIKTTDFSKIPMTNYDSKSFNEHTYLNGSLKNLSLNEEVAKIRAQISLDLRKMKDGDNRYGFFNVNDRESRVLSNQQRLKDMGVKNVLDYNNANSGQYNLDEVIGGNNRKLDAAMNEAGMIKSYALNGNFNYIDNKQVDQSKVKIDKHGDRAVGFVTESDAEAYVKNLQFYGS